MSTKTEPKQLFEQCNHCLGSGHDRPDSAIHESLPEHMPKVRRARKVTPICPVCLGRGYRKIPLTAQGIAELVAEHVVALEVAREFVDLCESGETSYLSDGALHGIYGRLTQLLDSAERAGRLLEAASSRQ
jgi:hypothetical protein